MHFAKTPNPEDAMRALRAKHLAEQVFYKLVESMQRGVGLAVST